MKRVKFPERMNFKARNAEIGFDFGELGAKYWSETVGYKFSADEIDRLETATNDLYKMTFDLVEDLLNDEEYHKKINLSSQDLEILKKSWENDSYSLYGRFDLFFDGKEIKLYEYNADTPTSLLESSLIQYYWMKDRGLPDQFNSIHEKLIAAWKFINENELQNKKTYFSCVKENQEDYRTVEYIMDTASQAGVDVGFLFIEDIGSDGTEFYDLNSEKIPALFKLYPWEWLLKEEFAETFLSANTSVIEPAWKLLLSNKALLVKLWEKYPNHSLLLETYFEEPSSGEFVKKPIYSREGANITLPGALETQGEYTDSGYVYQAYKPLPSFDGYHPMIGSWVIGDEAAGIGIREDQGLVTGNLSQFVPHWFE
jgi:glutathionylspermidine synthase